MGRPSESDHGAVLVEMAFVLPILTLILLATVDLGLAIREHQLLQNAAREGAHFSSLPRYQVSASNPTATIAQIQQWVVDYCLQEGIVINASDVTVNQNYTIPLSSDLEARGSEVTVTYDRQMLILGAPFIPSGTVTLTARSVFRDLY